MGVPCGELAEGLMRADHGGVDAPARGLGEVAREDVKEQPANVAKQLPIMAKEDAKHLGNRPDELSVGQAEQQILAEVLSEEEGSFLGA
jgi:hypothetical protein